MCSLDFLYDWLALMWLPEHLFGVDAFLSNSTFIWHFPFCKATCMNEKKGNNQLYIQIILYMFISLRKYAANLYIRRMTTLQAATAIDNIEFV